MLMRRATILATAFSLLTVSALAQAPTYEKFGVASLENFGWAVAMAGDVNGDTFTDWIVGAPGDITAAVPAVKGYVKVFSGKDGAQLLKIDSQQLGDRFGFAVTGLGDVDGDGFDDFAVGAPRFDSPLNVDAGAVYVFSGANGSQIHLVFGDSTNMEFGAALSVIGDVDADTILDFAVGAPGSDKAGPNFGAAYVLSGFTASQITEIVGGLKDAEFGGAVGDAGDLNNDGVPDLTVGAPFDQQATVPSGSAFGFTHSGTFQFVATGAFINDRFGNSVGSGGDFNADGNPDVVVGAPNSIIAGLNAGEVRVIAKSGATLQTVLALASNDNLGTSVDFIGDVNGDNQPDYIAGSPGKGRADVLSGKDGTRLLTFTLTTNFGRSVAFLGDANQDGKTDFTAGAPSALNPSAVAAGAAYVFPAIPASSKLSLDNASKVIGSFKPNGPVPDPVVRKISNIGDETLNWIVQVTGAPSWLTVTPMTGTIPVGTTTQDLTFTFNPAGLPKNTYTTKVRLTNQDNTNDQIILDVDLVVGDPVTVPIVCVVGPTVVEVTYKVGQALPGQVEFMIKNCGDLSKSLSWETLILAEAPLFAVVDPLTGSIAPGGPGVLVTLNFDPTGLEPDLYVGAIRFRNLADPANVVSILVRFTVELVGFDVGDIVIGTIDTPGAEDLAVFDALEGTKVLIKAGKSTNGLKPMLRLVDEQGADVKTLKFKSKASKKKFTFPTSGKYRLIVSGADGTTGAYQFTTKVKKIPKNAKPRLLKNQQPATGEIEYVAEVGAFPGALLTANVEVSGTMTVPQTTLVVETPAGQVYNVSAFTSTSNVGIHLINVPLDQVGVYKLKVGGFAVDTDFVSIPISPIQPTIVGETVNLD